MDRNTALKMRLRKIIREHAQQNNVRRQSAGQTPRLASILFEDAAPEKIDSKLFPTRLSAVDADMAKDLAVSGLKDKQEDDDTASAGGDSVPANSLKITQTTMDFGKFVGMSIQMMAKYGNFSGGAGGDLGAIISSDNHIMDGHHRWAATLMVDPSASVSGLRVDIPASKLVGVLNVWTAANGQKGKPSDTDMKSLTPEAVGEKFREMAEKGGGFLPSPEEILNLFKKNGFDSIDAAVEHVAKNWGETASQRTVQSWMPPKVDMPAIEPNQLETVKTDIASGKMDLNPPYGSEKAASATGTANESRLGAGVIVERWQKLAGILKG